MTFSQTPAGTAQVLDRLSESLDRGDSELARDILSTLYPAEVAQILESFSLRERLQLWGLVDREMKGDVLVEAHREVRSSLIEETALEELVDALGRVDIDALADVDQSLPDVVVDAVLKAMDAQHRERFEAVRAFPDDTAGGLMDTDALAVRDDLTLDVVLRYLRSLRDAQGDLPEHTDALMVVDRDNHFLGILSLIDLISLDSNQTVAATMDKEARAFKAMTPSTIVAQRFQQQDLLSAAVVDDEGKLLGRITADDVMDVIRELEGEAALSSAGLESGVDLFSSSWTSAKHRLGWLGVHLIGAFGAAWVIGRFEKIIGEMVALAMLMPVIAAAGGVAGNQTQALVTRGIALDQVGRANAARLLGKELGVGVIAGLIWAGIVGVIVGLWFHNADLAIVFGLALLISLVIAALAGTLIPLTLHRLGFDPALGSPVLVTVIGDIMGFSCFLGLAAAWMP